MKWLIHHGKRLARISAGIMLLIAGIILAIPGVPGPGFLVIFAGLSVLAIDFLWAHRLKTKMKDQAEKIVNKVRGKPASGGPRSVVADADCGRDGARPSN
jgi:UPF0716 family protein affecting phage T7 exclusion